MESSEKVMNVLNLPLPQGGRFALDLAYDKVIRIRFTQGQDFEPDSSYAVVQNRWLDIPYTITEKKDSYTVSTELLTIKLSLSPFALTVTDKSGKLRYQTSGEGLQLHKESWKLTTTLEHGEGVFGLGEHGETLNRVPGRFRFWNNDEDQDFVFKQYYLNIPVGISHLPSEKTHLFFLDNPGESFLDVGQKNPSELTWEVENGDFRLWLVFGDNPIDCVRIYSLLTGKMLRPPKWALGFHQCRWSYENEKRVRDVTSEYRKRKIPCDAIWLDIHYMNQYRVFTWNNERFPNPKKMIQDLKKNGFSTVCIIDPGVSIAEDYHCSAEGLKEKLFLKALSGELYIGRCWPGEAYYPDFTNPKTRKFWGKWQKEALLDIGIDGVWNDMNEPSVFHIEKPKRVLNPSLIHYDFGQYRPHKRIHNIYGLGMTQACQEGQLEARPNIRPFTLTRSGWAGVQRYTAVWTGDNRSAWTNMMPCIGLNLNMGLSGVPFVGCDIGGFADNATPELFVRWMEWGVFQPFTRAHSTLNTIDHEPWSFGKDAEKHLRRLIEQRYKYLPYIYTLFVMASETGDLINQPLMYAFPDDPQACRIEDQFMVGPSLMLAPVLEPGKAKRAVYLPEGTWHDGRTGDEFTGNQWILLDTPLGYSPILFREGSVIPTQPVRQHTKEPEPEVTILDVWPGDVFDGVLVEDDGATFAYRDWQEARTLFGGGKNERGYRLNISAVVGSFEPARKTWEIRFHGDNIKTILSNGKPLKFTQLEDVVATSVPDNRKLMILDFLY